MIIRDEKRKRKQSMEENDEGTSDLSDKYVAFKLKKSKKKSSKNEKEIQPTTSDGVPNKKGKKKRKVVHTDSSENEGNKISDDSSSFKVKKHKKSKKHKRNKRDKKPISSDSNSDQDDSVNLKSIKNKSVSDRIDSSTDGDDLCRSNAIIYSKPKIYKKVDKKNSSFSYDSDSDEAPQKSRKKLSQKSNNKNDSKELKVEKTKMEIIMPQTSIVPLTNFDEKMKKNSPVGISSLNSHDLNAKDASPLIVEANLKKPTKYYVPDILKDEDLLLEKEFEKHILSKAECTKMENEDQNNAENSPKQTHSGESSECIEKDSQKDISVALQEFYNDVSKGFEALVNKPRQRDMNLQKNSALSVDKSLKDTKNLKSIVSKNIINENNLSVYSNNIAQFFSLKSKVILVLQPLTKFSFLGKLKLKMLYGAVELYGSIFHPKNSEKPIDIYSPRGYSSITISAIDLEDTCNKEALWDYLASEGIDRSLKTKLHDAITQCEHGWSVLLLENIENTLTNFLNNYCSFKLFPKVENLKNTWCDPRRAEYVLQANFQFSFMQDEISICPQWNIRLTNQLLSQWEKTKSLCTMVLGGKSVGKSTSIRYLINNFLKSSNKVVLLDLDPGQAELTPPGCVSLSVIDQPLLGPNFTHLKKPFHHYYLDEVSVVNCISQYLESVKKLVEILKSNKELSQLPVVVNTMGFCKGIGVDIAIFFIKLIDPTNVIQIYSKKGNNNYNFELQNRTINDHTTSSIINDEDSVIMEKTCNYELHCVSSVAEGKRQFETWNMEPRKQRELVLLSYLSQIIENADEKSFCNLASNLISNSIYNISPFELPFSSFCISLSNSSTPPTHILSAMNGNIVSLCGIDLEDDISQAEKDALEYPIVIIKPPPSTCYGLGIIRGIDMQRRCVYISTPLTESNLQQVNLLAGCSPVPFSLLKLNSKLVSDSLYKADKDELPTSRETKRGFFRVDQSKKNTK